MTAAAPAPLVLAVGPPISTSSGMYSSMYEDSSSIIILVKPERRMTARETPAVRPRTLTPPVSISGALSRTWADERATPRNAMGGIRKPGVRCSAACLHMGLCSGLRCFASATDVCLLIGQRRTIKNSENTTCNTVRYGTVLECCAS